MDASHRPRSFRLWTIICLLGIAVSGIIWRLIDLNILNRTFLLKQSQARILRTITIPAYRGIITDRLGIPLAISTPMESVWIDPHIFHPGIEQIQQLTNKLKISTDHLESHLQNPHRDFIYLKRLVSPSLINEIKTLHIPGVFFQQEYKRFYPEGAVTGHVVGLTNISDHGQEGLELIYDQWLAGVDGKQKVIRDRLGQVIANLGMIQQPVQGHSLVLSLDHRIQYIAYSALKNAISTVQADSGSIVVLDPKTFEILAMVNIPSYDPNHRPPDQKGRYRNRAVTDVFEPGSTIKPFNIAFALESNKYNINSVIDTNPGWMMVGGYRITDHGRNYGELNLTGVLEHSSNIGAAKILLSLQPERYWNLLKRLGFGQRSESGFPGEASGNLKIQTTWFPSVIATLAYGYGIAVTTLQLAQAYAVLANDGVIEPVTFLKRDYPVSETRVLPENIARTVIEMLKDVVNQGTGKLAKIPGYQIAGKTGTAYIAHGNGYDKHKYVASFVGVAPVSGPRLVIAVVIRNPKGRFHFGGEIAAPVFKMVMENALRILNIPPDQK